MYMYYSHRWVLNHMDPLYSYSMGIAWQFPQSFLLYTVTTYILSLKNGSAMGQRLNPCAFLRLVRLSGRGSCPVCDSSGSPIVNGSLIPGRFTKCSGTGLHGNPTDVSPGGGNSTLEVGPKGLFFIASLSTAILFSTPSLS